MTPGSFFSFGLFFSFVCACVAQHCSRLEARAALLDCNVCWLACFDKIDSPTIKTGKNIHLDFRSLSLSAA
jgi:hypothetical protein